MGGGQKNTCVENGLDIIKVKFKVFEKEKDNAVWDTVAKDEKENYKEPLHMTVRVAGGAGSLIAGKPGENPEGFTWQVQKIPQRQPDRRKRVEKWTGLRLRKSKKKQKEEEIYGEQGDKKDDEPKDKDKKKCTKPSEWKKSQPILTLRGIFGARKPGDYDQMSLLKDPTSFKYMDDLEKAGMAKDLKKKKKKGEGEVPGREMVGPDGQIWPYGGMGAPWYQGPLCHPECTCLLRDWENTDASSKEYKLVKKLFDIVNAPPVPAKVCKDDDNVCETTQEKQQEVLNEIGEEIWKMMLASRPKKRPKSPSISASSEEGTFTYEEPEECVGGVCQLIEQELQKRKSEMAAAKKAKKRRSSRKYCT